MKKNRLVPKLRFPEFRDEGEWEEKNVEDIYDFKSTNSFSRENLNYKNGVIKNIHYGDIHKKFNTLFDIVKEDIPFINSNISIDNIKSDSYCIEGDMIFADASEDIDDIGKSIEIINLSNEKVVSGLHTLLARQKKAKLIVGFAGYLFKSDRIRSQIQREAQGSKVFGISVNRISNVCLSFPESFNEQQKIADCLTSLDQLITAETQKLESWKTHKKALMQKLFPAEGKTVPEWRFPEFRGKEEWEEKTLGECSFDSLDYGMNAAAINYDGENKYIRITDIDENSSKYISENPVSPEGDLLDKYIVGENDILFARTGASTGKTYLYNKEDGKLYFAGFLIRAKIKKDYNPIFIFTQTQTLKYNKWVKMTSMRSGQPGINSQEYASYGFFIPSKPEQQKIADCLSSLDELITAQTKKIELLKTHKKALMQGLFPDTEEGKK